MGTTFRSRASVFVRLPLLASLLAVSGCQGVLGPTTTPGASLCNGIPSDIGGCAPDRPSYTATTCEGLAEQWGAEVDRRVVAIINGPANADGKQRSVRLTEAIRLSSILAGMRMIELGIHESCDVANFLPIGKQQFSEELKAGIGGVLYDGDPVASLADWEIASLVTSASSTTMTLGARLPEGSVTGPPGGTGAGRVSRRISGPRSGTILRAGTI